ncbi:AAA family ATPase [Ralstonia pseudosolanacearum]|uniref:AAA family ATPase n=1 Tax=Ralstonia pseudosolanacearum TaxID=1310165 RepID=UPI003CE8634A
MKQAIGLCGPHRTGKTTLAKAFSTDAGIPFIVTSTSAVFAKHGLDPAAPMDFGTRLFIQDKVLDAAVEVWDGAGRGQWITDRTALDMLMYTLADIQGDTDADPAVVGKYAARCFEVTAEFFGRLVLVQPGIPLIYEAGKAALNSAYIEHLSALLLGLCHSEENLVPIRVIPKRVLDLAERVQWVRGI